MLEVALTLFRPWISGLPFHFVGGFFVGGQADEVNGADTGGLGPWCLFSSGEREHDVSHSSDHTCGCELDMGVLC